MIAGLRANGVEVVECHETLWRGIDDRVDTVRGGWLKPAFWARVVKVYWRLIVKYRQMPTHDALVVGYPGQFDVFLAWWLARRGRIPLVWDVLNSLYLISSERGLNLSNPLTTKLIKIIEKKACRLPDMLFLDNQNFIKWFKSTYDIDEKQFHIVPIGADDRIFNNNSFHKSNDDIFKVIYYGTYIPNHGVEYIVNAAKLLSSDRQIHFDMIGEGPEFNTAVKLAKEHRLENITFFPWKEREELIKLINNSDLVLGVFGTTKQVTLTNNNKIFEGFALMKPVLSGNSPAIPKEIIHGKHLYLCDRGSPESIAEAIRLLKSNPRLQKKLAQNGNKIFHQNFDIKNIGLITKHHLDEL